MGRLRQTSCQPLRRPLWRCAQKDSVERNRVSFDYDFSETKEYGS